MSPEMDKTLAPSTGEPTTDLRGMTLGERYVLRELLGAGGMGAVYLGHDTRLERDVAVKVILGMSSGTPMPPSAQTFGRFVREARASAALGHPGIVTVFDAGFNGAIPYIVMERLRGEPLSTAIARGPIPPDRAIAIFSRVLDALSAAHDAGLIHRDIKPANVFLCAPDDRPRILDFGVAGVTAERASTDPRLTAAGAGVGTPAYMAPEQLQGAAPDARADLYAVGASLYEALSGALPYDAVSLPQLCAQKLLEEPRPLSQRATTVPSALVAVVSRALARDPEARFQSAASMRSALDACATHAPHEAAPAPTAPPPPATSPTPGPATQQAFEVSARATDAPTNSPRPIARSVVARVAGALLVTVLGTLGIRALRTLHAPAVPSATPANHPNTSRPPIAGLQTLSILHDGSGSARTALTAPHLWELAAEDFRRAIQEANGRAPIRWVAAEHLARGRYALLQGQVETARREARAATAAEPEWAAAHLLLAEVLSRAGLHDEAIRAASQAETLEPSWWLPPMVLAIVLSDLNRWDESVLALRRAATLAPNEPLVDDFSALAMHAQGMDSEADRYAERALARDPDMLWSRVVRGERAIERGAWESAMTESNRVLSIAPRTATGHLIRGQALIGLGRRAEGVEALRRAIELLRLGRAPAIAAERVTYAEQLIAAGSPQTAGGDGARETASPSAPPVGTRGTHLHSTRRGPSSSAMETRRTTLGGARSPSPGRRGSPDNLGELGL